MVAECVEHLQITRGAQSISMLLRRATFPGLLEVVVLMSAKLLSHRASYAKLFEVILVSMWQWCGYSMRMHWFSGEGDVNLVGTPYGRVTQPCRREVIAVLSTV